MPVCSDCRYYKALDSESGICFGHMVQADQEAEECPTNSFQPIKEEENK